MPADDRSRALAARWLASAQGDLALARAADRDAEAPTRGVAHFVQQALEKGLKSMLVLDQIDFPKTHDLAVLAGLV
ncbi:MAG TPA: HEPN domain-containing protein, partial [Candidatus Limnocylindrales bacterium]|nr:HEPN domain-containing protein [Candidatus Limnocylindrales bacterium]